MAKEVTESAYDSVEPYFTARKQDSIEQKRAPTQGPCHNCASQVAVTWQSYDERKS